MLGDKTVAADYYVIAVLKLGEGSQLGIADPRTHEYD